MMDISFTQKEELNRLAQQYGLTLLYMFGSVARGDDTLASDIDFAYETLRALDLKKQFGLQQELQKILNVHKSIDLVNLANASPLLANRVLREGKIIFASKKAEEKFYYRTVKNYIDAKPLFQATQKFIQTYASR